MGTTVGFSTRATLEQRQAIIANQIIRPMKHLFGPPNHMKSSPDAQEAFFQSLEHRVNEHTPTDLNGEELNLWLSRVWGRVVDTYNYTTYPQIAHIVNELQTVFKDRILPAQTPTELDDYAWEELEVWMAEQDVFTLLENAKVARRQKRHQEARRMETVAEEKMPEAAKDICPQTGKLSVYALRVQRELNRRSGRHEKV